LKVVLHGNLKIATAQFENKSGDKAHNFDTITPDKLKDAGGYRYKKARSPDLYRDIIGQPHVPDQKVVWLNPGQE